MRLFILACATLITGICSAQRISGNNKMTKEERTVGVYDEISSGGSMEVIVMKGTGNLVIEGEENILPYVETNVEDGELKIRMKPNSNIGNHKKIKITTYTNTIEDVSTSGSGSITLENGITFNSETELSVSGSGSIQTGTGSFAELATKISGSGSITVSGTATKLEAKNSGSGKLNAKDLSVDHVEASCSGSGSITVTANKVIEGSLSGSGSILYAGNASTINVKKSGSGSVKKL